MSITLTTSQRAAVGQPTVQFTRLVELDSPHGVYRYAMAPTSWSGLFYEGRLLGLTGLEAGLGAPEEGVAAMGQVRLRFANADGYFTRERPSFYRNRDVTVREVLLDVETDAVRVFKFVGASVASDPSMEEFEITAEDVWGFYRRWQIPADAVRVSKELFATLDDNNPNIGTVIPLIYGRVNVELKLIDDIPAETLWAACVGSATLAGDITELFNDKLSTVQSARISHGLAAGGIPLTYVHVRSPISVNGQPTPHFADLIAPTGAAGRPDVVLIDFLMNQWGGLGRTDALVDSPSLVTAEAFYEANSIGFDCVVGEQRPLESWLGDWSRDALTRLTLRDRFVLIPQRSRAPVGSFSPANIVRDSLQLSDKPLSDEESRRIIHFTDRTRAQPETGVTSFAATPAEGAIVEHTSPFLGTPSAAHRVAQYWAKQAAAGVRQYEFTSTIRTVDLEEDDLVTLTHSYLGATGQLCRVVRTDRQGARIEYTLEETSMGVFEVETLDLPADPAFPVTQKFIPFVAGTFPTTSWQLYSGESSLMTIVFSHNLGSTPVAAVARFRRIGEDVASSITTADGTDATSQLIAGEGVSQDPLPLHFELLGWEVRL
jgi:hypothetical protein